MKTLLTFIFVIGLVTTSFAQFNGSSKTNFTFQPRALGFLTTLPPAAPGLDGNFYLYENFYKADLFFKDSSKVADVSSRFDLRDDVVEIDYNNSVRILPNSRVLYVVMERNGITEKYINGSIIDPLFKNMLLQVLYDDTVMLLSKTRTEIKHARQNPNPMLDVGQKDDQVLFIKSYIVFDGKSFAATSDGKSEFNARIIDLFGTAAQPLLAKKSHKKVDDLMELVKGLNQIAR
jgi:hypothetical protein